MILIAILLAVIAEVSGNAFPFYCIAYAVLVLWCGSQAKELKKLKGGPDVRD